MEDAEAVSSDLLLLHYQSVIPILQRRTKGCLVSSVYIRYRDQKIIELIKGNKVYKKSYNNLYSSL